MKVRYQYKHKCWTDPENTKHWYECYSINEQGFYDVGTKMCNKCLCEAHIVSRVLISA